MKENDTGRRLLCMALLLLAAFCGLGYRLIDIQVVRHEELLAKARDNTERAFHSEPPRGEIRDIRGNPLAVSVQVRNICADPTLIHPCEKHMARVLAPLLGVKQDWLEERLTPRLLRYNEENQPVFSQYVVLKREVSVDDWNRIHSVLTNSNYSIDVSALSKKQYTFFRSFRTHAVFAENDMMRVYPNKSLGAHMLGYVRRSPDGQGMLGVDGVERVMNAKLSGVPGWRMTETDRYHRELVAYRTHDVEARPGLNVVLSMDARIQQIVEQELEEAMKKHDPISASAVVVRPRTGEVIAMATLPDYDPNDPGKSQQAALRNRVISDISEPGSTFKIVVVSAGLQENLVTLNHRFDCERGHFLYAGRMLRDHHPYGVLTVENIITKSSNIGAAKIGILLGEERLNRYIERFGFGWPTAVNLPGEVGGILHPLDKWNKLSISRIPMGHEVAATPLQMVMAMAAIANEGRLMKPMIIDRLEDAEGNVVMKYQPQLVRTVINRDVAKDMVQALKTVVSKEGTGNTAGLEHWTVAGKTGTAQKAGNGGYVPGAYLASFIGFFPADDPELCISVMLDEPHNGYYGGATAGPIFRNIADRAARYLNIRPDRIVESTLAGESRARRALTQASRN